MWYLDVIKKLQSDKIDFALAGGFAVVLHGFARGTVDLDLTISLQLENLTKIESSLESMGLKSRLPLKAKEISQFRKDYIEKRNLIAWSFVDFKNPSRIVDILLIHDLKPKEIQLFSVAGNKIPVVNKKTLLEMKRKSGRPQDLEDIKALEASDEEN